MTPRVVSAYESLYDNLTKFLDYRVFGVIFSHFFGTVYFFLSNIYANSGLFFFCDRNNCLFIFVFTVAIFLQASVKININIIFCICFSLANYNSPHMKMDASFQLTWVRSTVHFLVRPLWSKRSCQTYTNECCFNNVR